MQRDSKLKKRSRDLRQNSTPAEVILWTQLRNRRLDGLKFRRQHVVGPFVVDFYCPEVAVVVELDGETHVGKEQVDEDRERWLTKQGLRVIRFWNDHIYEELDWVLEAIWNVCHERREQSRTDPSP